MVFYLFLGQWKGNEGLCIIINNFGQICEISNISRPIAFTIAIFDHLTVNDSHFPENRIYQIPEYPG